jgi:FkbM family methyltransferase
MSGMTEEEKFRLGLPTMSGLLAKIGENGFIPLTVIDVGANVGDWSRIISSVFTSSQVLMIDGDPDNGSALRATMSEIGNRAKYSITLLGPEERDTVMFHRLGTGSSILPELTSFASETIEIPMSTLDKLTESMGLPVPLLLKLDVQGFELEVLKGATRILELSEVVIMEVSLLPYNEGAPLFAEVVAFMSQRGFVVFDFCGQLRRETDSTLFQTDVVFVRHDSHLRAKRKFWLHEP